MHFGCNPTVPTGTPGSEWCSSVKDGSKMPPPELSEAVRLNPDERHFQDQLRRVRQVHGRR